jgi:hypothetical protein
MAGKKRSKVDRRSGKDRRQKNVKVKVERRKGKERRTQGERRAGWVRVSDWKSIWTEDPE